MYIIKKNSDVVPFESDHIKKSIVRAAKAVLGSDLEKKIDIESITQSVVEKIEALNIEKIGIEKIQDIVEIALMEHHQYDVAKSFILYRKARTDERESKNDLISYTEVMNGYLDQTDWRTKENSNVNYSLGGSILHNNSAITANYWLKKVYSPQIADAHKNADFHLHDLGIFASYCAGWSLRELLTQGITGVSDKVSSAPSKHLNTLCQQIVNFLGIMQNEWAGAQAFSSVDTYLAPFIKIDSLSYEQVYQCVQTLIYGINTPSRWGCQSPFSNFTLDWTVPSDMKDKKAIVGGKEQDFTYGDCQVEMDMFNKAFFEMFSNGDNQGRSFQYPIPTVNITPEFWNHNPENQEILFKLTSKFGTPYFQNFINSDIDPSDVRSMALMPSQRVIYKNRDGRVSVNEIRHLVNEWFLQEDKSKPLYEMLIDGRFVPVTEMFKIPYKKYGKSVSIMLSNGYVQPFSMDHKCQVLRAGVIQTILSQEVLESDSFILSKKPFGINNGVGTYDTGKIVGYFLAEGWYSSHSANEIVFAININQEPIVSEIKNFFMSIGCNVIIKKQEEVNIFRVQVYGKQAVGLVSNYIHGNTALTKRLSSNMWNSDDSFREGVYSGYYDTDGCRKEKNFAHTPNKDLIQDFIILSSSLGKILKYSVNKNNTRYFKEDKSDLEVFTSYKLDEYSSDETSEYFIVPVKEVKVVSSRAEFVYNFTVDTPEHLFELPNGIITHQCCRLRLDKRELRKRGGGLFGSAELTGSVGVVTLNLPRIGYLANDEEDFYQRLNSLMDIAKDSLEIKRKVLIKNLQEGLYPYTRAYISSFDNFFSTIGIVGLNEAIQNLFGKEINIGTEKGKGFAIEVLNHMRTHISNYQVETGNLYNLESTPAESTCYRLALHDQKKYPDIITAGSNGDPYYTNSSNLPVGFTDDPWVAIEHQEPLQLKYTGGTVFHAFLGQQVDNGEATRNFIKKVFENSKIPYLTISPVYSICSVHGYLAGSQERCPKCRDEQVKAYKKKLNDLKKQKSELELI